MGPNENRVAKHARDHYPPPVLSPEARRAGLFATQVATEGPPGVALFRLGEFLNRLSPREARQLGLDLILQAEIADGQQTMIRPQHGILVHGEPVVIGARDLPDDVVFAEVHEADCPGEGCSCPGAVHPAQEMGDCHGC
jgi:hypothetical protein